MINQTGMMENKNVDVFTKFWEEHCKEQIEKSYVREKNVSMYAHLSRNSEGEIIGHNLTGGPCCSNSVSFWMSCKM